MMLVRPVAASPSVGSERYAAFMSYSHALDGQLAPALQSGVEQFGRVWFRRRALRIFRDSTNLSAAPHLWASIEQALQQSEWFLLLASPESARSTWVRREVEWWLANRSPERLLVVVTGGSLAWDELSGRVDERRTDALPPVFVERGLAEPLWVDLRALRTAEPTDPAFQAAVVDIAATIRNLPKDELIGEQVRQHRKRRRSIALAAAALALLTMISAGTAVIAVQQRDRAEEQTRIAVARQLAGASEAIVPSRVDLARLLAASAYQMQPDPRSRSALLTATTASPQIERFLSTAFPITAPAVSSDGDEFVIGGADGAVDVISETGQSLVRVTHAPRPTTVVALDASGRQFLAGNESELMLWDRSQPGSPPRRVPTMGPTAAAALSSFGERIALLEHTPADEFGVARVSFLDAELRQTGAMTVDINAPRTSFPGEEPGLHMSFDTAEGVQIASGACDHVAVRTDGTLISTRSVSCPIPANGYITASSPSAIAGAFFKAGTAHVFTDADPDVGTTFDIPHNDGELLAVNHALDRVAVVRSGVVTVADQQGYLSMSGATGVSHIEFLRGSRLVVAAEGGAVLFNTAGVSPIARRSSIRVDDTFGFIPRPEVQVAPSGALASVVSEDPELIVIDVRTGQPLRTLPVADLGSPVVAAWSSDGRSLTAIGDAGRSRTWRVDGEHVVDSSAVSGPPIEKPIGQMDSAGYTASGTLRMKGVRGDVAELRPDGAAEMILPELEDYIVSALSPHAGYVVRTTYTTLEIIDLDSRRPTATLDLMTPPVGLTFPDVGHVLLTQADGQTSMITLTDGSSRRVGSVDAGNFNSVTAAGTTAVALGLDGTLAIRQIETGQSLGRFNLPASAPLEASDPSTTAVALSPDATTMVTATSGGGVLVWSLDPAAQVQVACLTAGHNLTPSEWSTLVGTDRPHDLRCGA